LQKEYWGNLWKVDVLVEYLFGKIISMDRFKEHKGNKYVLGPVDEYLARWVLESELEFSLTR
jgi:hypothetical protein